MYVYLLRTLSLQISKTKLLVKMASENGRIANLTEEDLQEIINTKDSKAHASNTSGPVIFTTSLNTMLYLYNTTIINKKGMFLMFSSKGQGVRAQNFKMMIKLSIIVFFVLKLHRGNT